MKRDTPGHWKVTDLMKALTLPRYAALGLIEALWHLTGRLAPHGDIGRIPNRAIAEGCYWEGDADALVSALSDSGWIDKSPTFRLVIHDWHDHCEEWVKKKVFRSGRGFASEHGGQRQPSADTGSLTKGQGQGSGQGLGSAEGGAGETERGVLRLSNAWPRQSLAQLANLYPQHRRSKSIATQNEMSAALDRIRAAVGHQGHGDPVGYMAGRLRSYAGSWAAQQGQYVPHITTWLRDGQYDDPPEAWAEPPPAANGTHAPDRAPTSEELARRLA